MSVTEPLPPARASLPMDDAVGRVALRKAGWRLLPLIGLGYGVSYIDRVNISFAALQMNRDLHFSAAVYGLGAVLFFLTYALFEVPSNWLLVRFGARRWIARIMFTWGVLATAMLFVRTPVQFYLMRLLLGAAEAGFFPGVIFYLSQWFPAAERGQGDQPVLRGDAALDRGHGRRSRRAAEPAGRAGPGRLAVAVPRRGTAGGGA